MTTQFGTARTFCSSTVKSVLFVSLLVASSGSHAQAERDNSSGDDEVVEEIVVTGSRIKRRDFSSPSPITTIDRETIEFTGQPTLEESLNQLPQIIPDLGRTSNNPGDGTAAINLRGMGPGRTLVMLNGRRLAPSGAGTAVDVNNLPQALIQRVEIITGGASTVYGSDAVAGVVNFITRDDFTGFNIDAGYNTTGKGDADVWDINVAYGHNFSRGNITLYGGYQEREQLFASERQLTSLALFNDFETGELVSGGSSSVPEGHIRFPEVDLGNGPASVIFNPDGTFREFVDPDDRYNFQPVNYLQIPLVRSSGGVFATFDLTDNYELYLESSVTRNEVRQNLAPVPVFLGVQVNIDNPVLTPEARQLFTDNYQFMPGMAGFQLRRRLTELDTRVIENDTDYWRTALGIRGEFADGWDVDGWVIYTKTNGRENLLNDASASRFQQGLLVDATTNQCFDPSGGCAPLDVFGEGRLSPEGAQFIQIPNIENIGDREFKVASVVVTGSPLDGWAGPIDVALGAEWRRDEGTFIADDILFTGDSLGYSGAAPIVGKETVTEVFGEVLIPLAVDRSWADYLALEIGGRYSDYDLAGGVNTYKIGGEWQPLNGLRFRVMHQRSVRAPNLEELFTEQFSDIFTLIGTNTSRDPCSASADPVGNGNAEKCIVNGMDPSQVGIFEATSGYGVNFIEGGNPELMPEEAETITAGVVISPDALPSWQLSIDWFDMELTDTIGSIDAMQICYDQKNTEHLFCSNVRRDATGNIFELFEPVSNRGILRTTGIDTQVLYATDLPGALSLLDGYAQLSVNVIWTHMLSNEQQENPVTTIIDCAGYFSWPCDFATLYGTLPEDRVTTNANYVSGPFTTHLTWRWIAGVKNGAPIGAPLIGLPPPMLAIPSISSHNLVDLGFGYQFTDGISARVGINNLLDQDAPLMADIANNTDASLYDVFGRNFYLSLAAQFGGQ